VARTSSNKRNKDVTKQGFSLGVMTIVAIMAVVLSAVRPAASAQEQSFESPFSHSTAVSLRPDDWKNGSRQHRWKTPYISDDGASLGRDSLNPHPFLGGPDPDFCISCTWPEGSAAYHGANG
jgi:hypothetical protein